MKTQKEITSKTEKQLSNLISFTGKYVHSLIQSARRQYGIQEKEIGKVLSAVKKRQFEQRKQKADQFNMSVAEYDKLKDKAKTILSAFHTGHSMGCYRALKINNKYFARHDTLDAYAKSSKWSPTYGSLTINLNKKELREIESIEGVWTIRHGDNKAKWLTGKGSKQYYEVIWEDGYLVETTHGKTLEQANEDNKKKNKEIARKQLADKAFVGFQHIRDLGACPVGIKAFCQRHNLNLEYGYNLGYLKSLGDSIAKEYLNRISN